MDGVTFSVKDDDAGGSVLALAGPMLVSTIGPVEHELEGLAGEIEAIDLSQVAEIDTVGAWVTHRLAKRHNAKVTGASVAAKRLLDAVESVITLRYPRCIVVKQNKKKMARSDSW